MKIKPEKQLKVMMRKIGSEDISSLAKLNKRVFGDSNASHVLEVFKYSFKNRIGEATILLETEDRVVIGAMFTEKYVTFSAKKAAWIRSFFIDPKWQKKGFGKMLLEKAIDKLQSKNYSIFLSVNENNSSAVQLYQKHGFKLEKLILKLDKKEKLDQ